MNARSPSRPGFPIREVSDAVGGTKAIEWDVVASRGYGRVSAHWRVSLADGRTAFVKHALTGEAAMWLRKERLLYESVHGTFMPSYLGAYDDDGATLIVLEDLSDATWPPPWSPRQVDVVLSSLDELHGTPPPDGIEALEARRRDIVGWDLVAADPAPFLATRLCSPSWLDEALPALMRAGAEAELGGDDLLHFDVRSDNLCLVGDRALMVDWNLACRGNGRFDVAFWLPSLRLEGGPPPWDVLPDAGPLAVAVAGFFAARAGLPPPVGAPTVREFQRAQAEVALPWAAQELGLAPPS